MRVLGKKITVRDFIPPIFERTYYYLTKKSRKGSLTCYFNPIIGSYSQYNEDLLIDVLLSCKKSGFYVDIGANDPEILNNTKRFYEKGWSGINIEPNFVLFEKLSRNRLRDINLNIGIGLSKGEMTFYQMSADTISSFDKMAAINSGKIYNAKLISTLQVPVLYLEEVLEKYLKGQQIDFMSIDVEGFDLIVLKSNNWDKFRPHLIMVEIGIDDQGIREFLETQNYILVFRNHTNAVFMSKEYSSNFISYNQKNEKISHFNCNPLL